MSEKTEVNVEVTLQIYPTRKEIWSVEKERTIAVGTVNTLNGLIVILSKEYVEGTVLFLWGSDTDKPLISGSSVRFTNKEAKVKTFSTGRLKITALDNNPSYGEILSTILAHSRTIDTAESLHRLVDLLSSEYSENTTLLLWVPDRISPLFYGKPSLTRKLFRV